MWGLIDARRRNDRGATVVVVAFAMVMLFAFAALAVDAGALWWDRKQLQNGADAGALAIAQACAMGPCNAGDADGFAKANKLDANATGQVTSLTANSVTVQAGSTRQLWFANVLGTSSAPVSAAATAKWGVIASATTLPLITSECDFQWAGGGSEATYGKTVTIIFKGSKDTGPLNPDGTVDCSAGPGGGGKDFPGGWGWLDKKTCQVLIKAGGYVGGDTGVATGSCLDPLVDRMKAGETVEIDMPIYDAIVGKGYHVSGFATLRLDAVCYKNGHSYDPTGACKETGKDLWIRGEFLKMASLGEMGAGTPGKDYGTRLVWLSS